MPFAPPLSPPSLPPSFLSQSRPSQSCVTYVNERAIRGLVVQVAVSLLRQKAERQKDATASAAAAAAAQEKAPPRHSRRRCCRRPGHGRRCLCGRKGRVDDKKRVRT